jgi:hypothetical protein
MEKKKKEEISIYQLVTVAQRQIEEELRPPASQQNQVVVVAAAGESFLQPALAHLRCPVTPQRQRKEAGESFLPQQAHSPKEKTNEALIGLATQTLVAEQCMEEKVIHQLDMPMAQQRRQLGHPSVVPFVEEQTKEGLILQPAYSWMAVRSIPQLVVAHSFAAAHLPQQKLVAANGSFRRSASTQKMYRILVTPWVTGHL